MKELRISAVANDALAVARLLVEPEGHAVEAVVGAKGTRVHKLCRFGAKNLLVSEFAILQMRNHESRHVPGSGGNAARRKRFDKLKGMGFFGRLAIAERHE